MKMFSHKDQVRLKFIDMRPIAPPDHRRNDILTLKRGLLERQSDVIRFHVPAGKRKAFTSDITKNI